MILLEKELELFTNVHVGLCLYVGKKYKLISAHASVEDYLDKSPELKLKVRDKLLAKIDVIDEFVKKNPLGFNQEEIDICLGFKNYIFGEFFVVKYLKKHTVFLGEDIAYGVHGLLDSIEFVLNGMKPARAKGLLLPFKDKIVYDGLLQTYNIYFGGNYASSINREYDKAKANYGIVTTLPFAPTKLANKAEQDLEFYMKNAKNREYYYYEIEELLDKNPHLVSKYYWLWGKINSRTIKKNLKSYGISGLHYAVIDRTVVAMAESAYQIKEMVKAILPKEKHDWVFYFKV